MRLLFLLELLLVRGVACGARGRGFSGMAWHGNGMFFPRARARNLNLRGIRSRPSQSTISCLFAIGEKEERLADPYHHTVKLYIYVIQVNELASRFYLER